MPTRTDVAAFLGIAARGPVGRIQVVEGWPEFVALYGDFLDNAYLAFAVRGFFDNGGLRCHILRVAALPLETRTSGPQPLDGASSALADAERVKPGALATLVQTNATLSQGAQPPDRKSSVVASVAGMVAGNRALLQQAGMAPVRREIVSVDPVTMAIVWGEALPAEFDLTQPISLTSTASDRQLVASVAGNIVSWSVPLDARFDLGATIHVGFGAGAAGGVLHNEHGDPLLSVEAANPGTWGNALTVRLTTHYSGDYTTRQRPTPDPAGRLSLDRVDGLLPGALIEISQEGAAGQRTLLVAIDAAGIQVTLADPLVGFDLAAAADGTKPILLRRRGFNLSVRENGRLVETHPDLDLPAIGAPGESPVNQRSARIRIARLPGPAGSWPDHASPMLDRGELRLSLGRDGIAMLRASDFTGTIGLPPAGLALFEDCPEPAAIALADIMLPATRARETLAEEPPAPDPCRLCPEPPAAGLPPVWGMVTEASPGFDQDTIESIQRALVELCERRGDCLALLDPPIGASGECPDWPDLFRWRQRFDSSYAVAYHPWVDVADPLGATLSPVRRVPPSGHALGQYALSDREPGRAAPANRRLAFAAGTACEIDDTRHAMLNERGLNAITARPGRGIRIMGARTMASAADWKQLVVRRLFIRLKRAIRRELSWAVFEPADARLEDRLVATLEGLLERQWQAGRLLGARQEEAFRIAILREAAAVDNGELVVLVAVAPAQPAEFLFLRLSFTLDAMNLAELTAGGGWPS